MTSLIKDVFTNITGQFCMIGHTDRWNWLFWGWRI